MRQSTFWNCLSRTLSSPLQPHGLSLQRWRNKANPSVHFLEAEHDLVRTRIRFREQIWSGGGAGKWAAEVGQALASSLVFWALRQEGRAAGGRPLVSRGFSNPRRVVSQSHSDSSRREGGRLRVRVWQGGHCSLAMVRTNSVTARPGAWSRGRTLGGRTAAGQGPRDIPSGAGGILFPWARPPSLGLKGRQRGEAIPGTPLGCPSNVQARFTAGLGTCCSSEPTVLSLSETEWFPSSPPCHCPWAL